MIPWLDAAPSASPAAAPTLAPDAGPACTSEDLDLFAEGWGGATGSLAGGATVVDDGTDVCHLKGRPSVQLLDATGTVIAESSKAVDSSPAEDAPVALALGEVAISGTMWSNWCGDPPVYPLSLRLTLPAGGGTLTAPLTLSPMVGFEGAAPRCDDPRYASGIGAGVFEVPDATDVGTPHGDCAARDLVAFLGPWGAAAGTSYASLVVLNVSGFSCTVAPTPTLELRDAHGKLVRTASADPQSGGSVAIPVGRAGMTQVLTSNWCQPVPEGPLAVDIVVGGTPVAVGGTVATISGCSAQGVSPVPDPTFAYAGPFAVPPIPPPPEEDIGNVLPFTVSVSALPVVHPGQALTFTVNLTNATSFGKTLNLPAACPNYLVRLFLPDNRSIEERHALNCAPVGTLQSGETVSFSMQVAIPEDAPSGTGTLIWILGDRGAASPKLPVTFEGP